MIGNGQMSWAWVDGSGTPTSMFLCLEAATDAKPVAYRLYSDGTPTAYRCTGISTEPATGQLWRRPLGRARILFFSHSYLGGVPLVSLRFGASFGPDRGKARDRCLSGRLAWRGVFMANDDKGTRVPALRDLCIVASFPHKRQAGGTKEKAGGRPIGGQSPAHSRLIIEQMCGKCQGRGGFDAKPLSGEDCCIYKHATQLVGNGRQRPPLFLQGPATVAVYRS